MMFKFIQKFTKAVNNSNIGVKFFLTFGLIMLLLPISGTAKIWTVDNTPGAGADSTNLQGVVNKATAGDTIIVMPSNTNYSSIVLNKKLFIYSRGHTNNYIDKDRYAEMGTAAFNAGSSGSVIKGMRITSFSLSADGILIQNCYFYSSNPSYIYSSNNIVEGCIFTAENSFTNIAFLNATASNNIIKNNYFSLRRYNGSISSMTSGFIQGGNSTNLILNNIFIELADGGTISSGGLRFFYGSYAKIYNNICWSNVPNKVPFQESNAGSVFKNNITYSVNNNPDPLPGFNYNDTMPNFEGGYDATTKLPYYRVDNDMRLKSSSVGKNGATDSADCGVYGQGYAFSIEGNVDGVAIFRDFEVLNPVVKRGGTLRVKLTGIKPEN